MADILNRLPDERKECLELELSRESNGGVDELQLAALLGKTLLEKNGELELKLKRLQDFAEETLVTNQTLSRQFSESRDSLQFSNKSCEQLELRIEELEKANRDLQKLCDSRQSVIDQKTAANEHLEEKLDRLHEDYSRLREQCAAESSTENPALRSKSNSLSEPASFPPQPSAQEITELQDTVDGLTLKLQNAGYQKQKFESELRQVLSENQALGRNLERAELEIAELQARLRVYEEASERQRLECSPSPQKTPVSTPGHASSYQRLCTSPSADESPLRLQKSPKANESGLGASLFSELDTQYTDLQWQYEDLLQQCTCSASLSHVSTHGGLAETSEADGLPALSKGNSSPLETPFKVLFDEMFATLKQTAEVADRLIERKKNTN